MATGEDEAESCGSKPVDRGGPPPSLQPRDQWRKLEAYDEVLQRLPSSGFEVDSIRVGHLGYDVNVERAEDVLLLHKRLLELAIQPAFDIRLSFKAFRPPTFGSSANLDGDSDVHSVEDGDSDVHSTPLSRFSLDAFVIDGWNSEVVISLQSELVCGFLLVLVVKVADFGVARVQDETGKMTAETGTISLDGSRGYRTHNKADVFSFGIVQWELLTGEARTFNLVASHKASVINFFSVVLTCYCGPGSFLCHIHDPNAGSSWRSKNKRMRPLIPENANPSLAELLASEYQGEAQLLRNPGHPQTHTSEEEGSSLTWRNPCNPFHKFHIRFEPLIFAAFFPPF
ncbi:hypothetical protein MLD38_029560 [Melastoma candidum]|uniref:Uncharacterized protein n=1 Tax=Melastoma candidum TaxID=119954 RepID=A0ACB9N6N5_9MYRT|nr:hypothetical protein MLD38_029560 [Melastoma candidum]